tara:strand:- start:288 stop:728 length:441 start_codon:yes stop_codon:yes gene_type:complete
MKKLLNEWRRYLTEQEDAAPDQEAGAGATPEETAIQAPAQAVIKWGANLNPQTYRKILQAIAKHRTDAGLGDDPGSKRLQTEIGNFLGKGMKRKLTVKEAYFYYNNFHPSQKGTPLLRVIQKVLASVGFPTKYPFNREYYRYSPYT